MTRRRAALLLGCALTGTAQEVPRPTGTPYKGGRGAPAGFEGPGRELPEPTGLREILIGYYGPEGDSHADGAILWQGAALALDELNREGGYEGKPFRLVSRWSENPWRGGAAAVTRMAFEDRVWAIVGSVDGAGTHLAEQVVVKALLALVNPVATDRSIHMAGVPWMFSVVQGDDQHTRLLAAALEGRGVVLFSATDHDSRAFTAMLRTAFGQSRTEIRLLIEFEPDRPELTEPVRSMIAAKPETVVVIAGARPSARCVLALREAGYAGTVAGGPWFGRAVFAEGAGSAAEGALFPSVGEISSDFERKFSAAFQHRPDYAAAGAYDAVRIVAAAIRTAGANRARIRDAIEKIGIWHGAGGDIEWDEYGQNQRSPVLVRIAAGRAVLGKGATR